MRDVIDRLHEHGRELDSRAPTLSEIRSRARLRSSPTTRRPGWVFAIGAAALILVTIGGFALLTRSSVAPTAASTSSPSTTIASTTAPPATTVTTTATTITMPPSTMATTAATTIPTDPTAPTVVTEVTGCVRTIDIDPSGTVWAGCNTSIFRQQGDEWLRIPVPESVLDFTIAGDGTVVAVTWKGPWDAPTFWLATWDGDAWDLIEVESAYAVASAPDGSVWAATREPVRVYRNGAWESVAGTIGWDPGVPDQEPGERDWFEVAVDGTGAVWLSHEYGAGAFRWNGSLTYVGGGYERFWAAPDGRVWARGAAEAQGDWSVFVYGGGRWERLTDLDGVYATDIAFDEDGGVWVATDGDGLLYGDGTTWTRVGADSGVPSTVSAVAIDGDEVWVGTGSGLIRLDRSN